MANACVAVSDGVVVASRWVVPARRVSPLARHRSVTANAFVRDQTGAFVDDRPQWSTDGQPGTAIGMRRVLPTASGPVIDLRRAVDRRSEEGTDLELRANQPGGMLGGTRRLWMGIGIIREGRANGPGHERKPAYSSSKLAG